MQHKSLLLVSALPIILAACKKDDEPGNSQTEPVAKLNFIFQNLTEMTLETNYNPFSNVVSFHAGTFKMPMRFITLEYLNPDTGTFEGFSPAWACAFDTEEQCLIDLGSESSLERLNQDVEIKPGTYNIISVQTHCMHIDEDDFDQDEDVEENYGLVKVKGMFEHNNATYYTTQVDNQIVTTDASDYGEVTIRFNCSQIRHSLTHALEVDQDQHAVMSIGFNLNKILHVGFAPLEKPSFGTASGEAHTLSSWISPSFNAAPKATDLALSYYRLRGMDDPEEYYNGEVYLVLDSDGIPMGGETKYATHENSDLSAASFNGLGWPIREVTDNGNGSYSLVSFKSPDSPDFVIQFPAFKLEDHVGQAFELENGEQTIDYAADKVF